MLLIHAGSEFPMPNEHKCHDVQQQKHHHTEKELKLNVRNDKRKSRNRAWSRHKIKQKYNPSSRTLDAVPPVANCTYYNKQTDRKA